MNVYMVDRDLINWQTLVWFGYHLCEINLIKS